MLKQKRFDQRITRERSAAYVNTFQLLPDLISFLIEVMSIQILKFFQSKKTRKRRHIHFPTSK
ncbi:hypothetical protein L483_16910 [Pseudomonas putida H8234]|nr:hypothetical protein L483_16910 [Pseudomonas putida H8234]